MATIELGNGFSQRLNLFRDRYIAPKQYWRAQPREHKDLFEGLSFAQR